MGLSIPVFVKDQDFNMVWFSKSFGDISGFRLEDYRGHSDFEMRERSEATRFRAHDEEAIRAGAPIINRFRLFGENATVVKWPVERLTGTYLAGAIVTPSVCAQLRSACASPCAGTPTIECVMAGLSAAFKESLDDMSSRISTLQWNAEDTASNILELQQNNRSTQSEINRLAADVRGLRLLLDQPQQH